VERSGKNKIFFRTLSEEENDDVLTRGILADHEWISKDSANRIEDPSWVYRYDYESSILSQIINEHKIKNILEVGSGPGTLCKSILDKSQSLEEYHLVDIEAARKINEEKKLGGIFHVTDLNEGINVDFQNKKFDLFIANDVLEHVQNPAKIILQAKENMIKEGYAFISIPNWRMGHTWVYKGLFDWDNFMHFMWVHGFEPVLFVESPLKCAFSRKLDSEITMPDELIDSWNFYILFKRND
jgi:2-polyprenyl-3-methyl-5-hydroxy-6-metoxy-1,4-benzoquinol methylase